MGILKQIILRRCICTTILRPFHGSSGFTYISRYNPEDQKKILQTLNDSTSDQLAGFAISKTRIERLEKFRIKNGPFHNLNQVLEVEGLSVKTLEQLCDSIISEKDQRAQEALKSLRRTVKGGLVTPSFSHVNRSAIRNVVGLHVTRHIISWANLTKERELVHWDMFELPEQIKAHPSHLYEVMVKMKKLLPVADLYVLEDIRNDMKLLSDLQFYQLRTILYTLLNCDDSIESSISGPHRVFFLKNLISARLFERLVGNEKVSAQSVVAKLLAPEHARPVDADFTLRIAYGAKSNVEKEVLCEALLLTTSFMDLVVLENVKLP